MRHGLLDGLDSKFDASANLLRGQAAQIMLNVLKANMVEYGQAFKFTDAQKQLIDKYGLTQESAAKKLGMEKYSYTYKIDGDSDDVTGVVTLTQTYTLKKA